MTIFFRGKNIFVFFKALFVIIKWYATSEPFTILNLTKFFKCNSIGLDFSSNRPIMIHLLYFYLVTNSDRKSRENVNSGSQLPPRNRLKLRVTKTDDRRIFLTLQCWVEFRFFDLIDLDVSNFDFWIFPVVFFRQAHFNQNKNSIIQILNYQAELPRTLVTKTVGHPILLEIAADLHCLASNNLKNDQNSDHINLWLQCWWKFRQIH